MIGDGSISHPRKFASEEAVIATLCGETGSTSGNSISGKCVSVPHRKRRQSARGQPRWIFLQDLERGYKSPSFSNSN